MAPRTIKYDAPNRQGFSRYNPAGDLGPGPGQAGFRGEYGTGEIDWADPENDPTLRALVEQRLAQEFGTNPEFEQMLRESTAQQGPNSRIADIYNAARQSTRANATAAREGIRQAYEQYQKDVAASNALQQPNVGVQTQTPTPPPGILPEAQRQAGEQQAALDALAQQRAQGAQSAAQVANLGASQNVNLLEQNRLGEIDAEAASKMAQYQGTTSTKVEEARNKRSSQMATRERQIWDQIKKSHGIDPITGERTATASAGKLSGKQRFVQYQNAYQNYLNDVSPGTEVSNSRAGQAFQIIADYAAEGRNDTERYNRARKAMTEFFRGNDFNDSNGKWDKKLKDESPNTYALIYGSGKRSKLNFEVIKDWVDSFFGNVDPEAVR